MRIRNKTLSGSILGDFIGQKLDNSQITKREDTRMRKFEIDDTPQIITRYWRLGQ